MEATSESSSEQGNTGHWLMRRPQVGWSSEGQGGVSHFSTPEPPPIRFSMMLVKCSSCQCNGAGKADEMGVAGDE